MPLSPPAPICDILKFLRNRDPPCPGGSISCPVPLTTGSLGLYNCSAFLKYLIEMEEDAKQKLIDQFAEQVERINQAMHRRPLDDWEGMDLTIPQIKTLALLHYQGPLRMGGLSNSLGSTFSAATSIVDRLVDKALVERVADPEDRRAVVCHLTDAGQESIERFWRVGKLRIVEMAEPLSVEELETVVRAMDLLCRVYDGPERETRRAAPGQGN